MKFEQVRRAALSLPQAREAPHHALTSFRVGDRIFATAPADGRHLHVFVDEDERAPLIARAPAVYETLRWGAKVVGLRVDLARAEAGVVGSLLRAAWRRKAPAALVAATPAADAGGAGATPGARARTGRRRPAARSR